MACPPTALGELPLVLDSPAIFRQDDSGLALKFAQQNSLFFAAVVFGPSGPNVYSCTTQKSSQAP